MKIEIIKIFSVMIKNFTTIYIAVNIVIIIFNYSYIFTLTVFLLIKWNQINSRVSLRRINQIIRKNSQGSTFMLLTFSHPIIDWFFKRLYNGRIQMSDIWI